MAVMCHVGVGKVMVDVRSMGLDMATVVGHKFGAPKGVGALYLSSFRSVPLRTCALSHGGGQEFGLRSGTECVLLITALGAACDIARQETRELAVYLLRLKATFMRTLAERAADHNVS